MFPPLAPRPQGSSRRRGTRTQAWSPRDPHHASSLVVSPGEMDLPITHTGIVLGRMLFNVAVVWCVYYSLVMPHDHRRLPLNEPQNSHSQSCDALRSCDAPRFVHSEVTVYHTTAFRKVNIFGLLDSWRVVVERSKTRGSARQTLRSGASSLAPKSRAT